MGISASSLTRPTTCAYGHHEPHRCDPLHVIHPFTIPKVGERFPQLSGDHGEQEAT